MNSNHWWPVGSNLTMKSEMQQCLTEQKKKIEKFKAANFQMKMIRIGFFKVEAKYPSDLVAKCYYARKKLVWEILIDGLQKKIEIQWENISAIRAVLGENSQGILEIELSKVPLFFREIGMNRNHRTKWTTSQDFTNGYASLYRRHYLEFDPGVLDKHYLNLLQCNDLSELSRKPFPNWNSVYFDSYLDERTTHSSYGHEDLHVNGSQSALISDQQPIVVSPQEVHQTSGILSLPNEATTQTQMLQDPRLTSWSEGFYSDPLFLNESLPFSSNIAQNGLGVESRQQLSSHVNDLLLPGDFNIPHIEFDKIKMEEDVIKSSNEMTSLSNRTSTISAHYDWSPINKNSWNTPTNYYSEQHHRAAEIDFNYMPQEEPFKDDDQCWFYPEELFPSNFKSNNVF